MTARDYFLTPVGLGSIPSAIIGLSKANKIFGPAFLRKVGKAVLVRRKIRTRKTGLHFKFLRKLLASFQISFIRNRSTKCWHRDRGSNVYLKIGLIDEIVCFLFKIHHVPVAFSL